MHRLGTGDSPTARAGTSPGVGKCADWTCAPSIQFLQQPKTPEPERPNLSGRSRARVNVTFWRRNTQTRAWALVEHRARDEIVTRWLPDIEICYFCSRESMCSVGSGPRGRRACPAVASGEGGFKSYRPDHFSISRSQLSRKISIARAPVDGCLFSFLGSVLGRCRPVLKSRKIPRFIFSSTAFSCRLWIF